ASHRAVSGARRTSARRRVVLVRGGARSADAAAAAGSRASRRARCRGVRGIRQPVDRERGDSAILGDRARGLRATREPPLRTTMRAILTYHSIDESGSVISVGRETFAAQAAWLASGRVRVTTVDELLALPPDADAVALTFDDGFQNFADTAVPVLERHGLRA